MLRITTHELPEGLTIQLEGRLAGPWVRELNATWQAAIAQHRGQPIRVDLTAVTFVDANGKDLLASIHRHGTGLTAAGCLMKAIVADVTCRSWPPKTPEPQQH